MSDIRIRYLKLVGDQPLLFSAFCTVVLCSTGTIGLIAEMGKICRPDLRLWLSVVIIRSAIRLVSRLYVAGVTTGMQGARSGNSKFVDILDVFGIVWFAVGNLLVFNDFGCIDVSPIVFFTSFFYIAFSYISFFTPSVIRCTLGICRPTAEADLLYLRHTADADREAAFIARNTGGPGRAVELGLNRDTNPELTAERARYWADWLQTYGCYEVVYHPDMDLKGKQRRWKERQYQAQQEGQNSGSGSGSGAGGMGSLRDIETGEGVEAVVGSQGQGQGQVTGQEGCPDQDQFVGPSGRRREYVSVPTSNAGDEDLPVFRGNDGVGEGEGEADFCSVCLLPFECPPPAAPLAPSPATTAAAAASVSVSVAEAVGQTAGEAAVLGGEGSVRQQLEEQWGQQQQPEQADGRGQDEERNWVIVRYPCQGHHYFHAHCLHSWLQVCSARYLTTNRVPLGAELRTDHRVQVTCPCCREHPRSLLDEEVHGGQQAERPGGAPGGGARAYGLLR